MFGRALTGKPKQHGAAGVGRTPEVGESGAHESTARRPARGKFPFKGEEDVKFKKLIIPKRRGSLGGARDRESA